MSFVRRLAALVGAVFALAATALVVTAGTANAHVRESMGYSTVVSAGDTVNYTLSLEYDILAKAVDLGPGARAATTDAARQGALEQSHPPIAAYLKPRLALYLDDVGCEPTLSSSSVTTRDQAAYAVLDLQFDCAAATDDGGTGLFRLDYEVFREADAVTDDHENVVDYRLGGHEGRAVLGDGETELRVGESSMLATALRFAGMGIEHILSGLDHVLFVIALALGARGLRSLAAVVTTFTLAHSITLIAALVGWVHVPAEVVEPLIALSIVFVALDNLIGSPGRSRARLLVVFAFGLLHGLGFAGSLTVSDDVTWGLVGSLVSFNVGIEIGQALLLAAVLPLLALVRRSRFSTPINRVVTAVVATFGLFWFGERFLLNETSNPTAALFWIW